MVKTKIFMVLFIVLSLFLVGCTGNVKVSDADGEKGGAGIVKIIQTSTNGDRLATKGYLKLTGDGIYFGPSITVDPGKTYQTITGFGGSFTESAAYVLSKLPAAVKKEALMAYYSTNGAAYSLARTHIGSCDFSLSSYSYDDTENDLDLKKFSIDHDKTLLIPLIKEAMNQPGAGFKLLSSPWSPPGWMKTTGQMVSRYSHLKRECYDAYAKYLSKYVQAYAKEGINVWAMTVQNESWNDMGLWETCQYSPAETQEFIFSSMGPQFEKDNIQTKIFIYDHNKGYDDLQKKGNVQYYVDTVMQSKKAAKYVYGVGVHWYGGDWFDDIAAVHNDFPNLHILHTEGCQEGGPHIGDYAAAERYGHDIIGDLNNWAEGWLDWNIVLDQDGGPNHARNYCSAPILADLKNNKLIYNPSYYYMVHFSKFIRPGALKLDVKNDTPDLETTAFKNTDGSIVVVIMNQTDLTYDFKLKIGDKVIFPTVTEHSLVNFVVKP